MKLRKRYIIEYIDNERDLDILDAGTHPAPWELFKKEIIEEKTPHEAYTGADSIDGTAWIRFIVWSLCPEQIYISKANRVTHPLYCQMWMEMLDEEGNVVYEDICKLPGTIKYNLYSAINKQVYKERNSANETASALETELEAYKAFIKECHAEKTFKEWREKNDSKAD